MTENTVPEDVPANATAADAAADTEELAQAEQLADWKVFRVVVAVIGLVLLGIGLYEVITGTKGVPGFTGTSDASLESSYRFLAGVFLGAGLAFIAIAIKFQWAQVLFFVSGMVFLGGLARVLSWALSGTPTPIAIFQMIAELVFPPVIVVWYLWINRTQKLRASYRQPVVLPQD